MTRLPAKVKHYRILSELAQGSGSYLADDELLKRQVVLKQLRPDALATPQTLQNFRETVKKLSKNPEIPVARTIELLQLRADGGLLRFLVREYREGLSLEGTLLRRGQLPPGEVAGWIAMTARGLNALHGTGTIHGNLTAANVILDPAGRVHLCDYGLPGGAASRSYLAPEVLDGAPPSRAADLYSLGAIWCRILCGQYPGPGGAPEAARIAAGLQVGALDRLLEADPGARALEAAEERTDRRPTPARVATPSPPRPASTPPAGNTAPVAEAMPPRAHPPAPAAPPSAPVTPTAAAAEGIDWDRIITHIAKAPPEVDATAATKRRRPADVPQVLPNRTSEAPSQRPARFTWGRMLHRVATIAQFVFVLFALGTLLQVIGDGALSTRPDPAAVVKKTPTPAPASAAPGAPDVAAGQAAPVAPTRDPSMCPIAGGEFLFQHPFTSRREKTVVKPFEIDRYEVSNAQYLEFTRQAGHVAEGNWQRYFLPGLDRYPVVAVSYRDAQAYARWAGKRLPSAAEWQFACGGTGGDPFPWGAIFDPARAVWSQSRKAAPVDSLPEGNTPAGVHHMAGNVWEWVADAPGGRYLAVGGSFQSDPFSIGTLARMIVPVSGFRAPADYGFRCAK